MAASVLCIGASLVDHLYFCGDEVVKGTSNPAEKTTAIGGVMGNIVQHLALLGAPVAFLTALGKDANGSFIRETLTAKGVDLSASCMADADTGTYVSILEPNGSLNVAVCQDQCSAFITPDYLAFQSAYIRQFDLIVADTNLSPEALQWLINHARIHQQQLVIEPVSVPKAKKLSGLDLQGVFMVTPNEDELQAMASEKADAKAQAEKLFNQGISRVWLRCGAQGSEMYQSRETLKIAVPVIDIKDSTGAGDAALAGWLYGYMQGASESECIQLGHALAFIVLQAKGAVNPTLTKSMLHQYRQNHYHE